MYHYRHSNLPVEIELASQHMQCIEQVTLSITTSLISIQDGCISLTDSYLDAFTTFPAQYRPRYLLHRLMMQLAVLGFTRQQCYELVLYMIQGRNGSKHGSLCCRPCNLAAAILEEATLPSQSCPEPLKSTGAESVAGAESAWNIGTGSTAGIGRSVHASDAGRWPVHRLMGRAAIAAFGAGSSLAPSTVSTLRNTPTGNCGALLAATLPEVLLTGVQCFASLTFCRCILGSACADVTDVCWQYLSEVISTS